VSAEPLRVPQPSAADIPVAVPGGLVIARQPGLLAWAGAFTVTPDGFEFALRITTTGPCGWALHEEERNARSWLEVRYPDGRACESDLNDSLWQGGEENLVVAFLYGSSSSSATETVDNSQWWVSPLPPPGPVDMILHLNGALGAAWAGRIDSAALRGAAGAR
jgi:hypothetical protein